MGEQLAPPVHRDHSGTGEAVAVVVPLHHPCLQDRPHRRREAAWERVAIMSTDGDGAVFVDMGAGVEYAERDTDGVGEGVLSSHGGNAAARRFRWSTHRNTMPRWACVGPLLGLVSRLAVAAASSTGRKAWRSAGFLRLC